MRTESKTDEFMATFFNLGVVVNGNLEDITNFKELVGKSIDATGARIVFQRLDPRKLKIVPEGENYEKE